MSDWIRIDDGVIPEKDGIYLVYLEPQYGDPFYAVAYFCEEETDYLIGVTDPYSTYTFTLAYDEETDLSHDVTYWKYLSPPEADDE